MSIIIKKWIKDWTNKKFKDVYWDKEIARKFSIEKVTVKLSSKSKDKSPVFQKTLIKNFNLEKKCCWSMFLKEYTSLNPNLDSQWKLNGC